MNYITKKMEECDFSVRESALLCITLFCLGVLLGILVSPKGKRIYGSYNGSNNVGSICEDDEDEE